MKREFMWLALLCFSGIAMAQDVVRSYPAELALDMDTQGHVVAAAPVGDMPAALVGPMQSAVQHWRFKPVQDHGVAATARTYVRVRMDVVQQAPGSYGLRVVYIKNGPSLNPTRVPAMSPEMYRDGVHGHLVMEGVVRPDGTVADLQMTEAKFPGVRAAPFRQFATEALQHMKAMPEMVAGQPVATRIRVPFFFNEPHVASEAGDQGKSEAHAAQAMPSPAPTGEAVALDSPVAPLEVGPKG